MNKVNVQTDPTIASVRLEGEYSDVVLSYPEAYENTLRDINAAKTTYPHGTIAHDGHHYISWILKGEWAEVDKGKWVKVERRCFLCQAVAIEPSSGYYTRKVDVYTTTVDGVYHVHYPRTVHSGLDSERAHWKTQQTDNLLDWLQKLPNDLQPDSQRVLVKRGYDVLEFWLAVTGKSASEIEEGIHEKFGLTDDFTIVAVEGFGDYKIAENKELTIDELEELMEFVDEHGDFGLTVLDEMTNNSTVQEAIDIINNRYTGEYDNVKSYAESYAELIFDECNVNKSVFKHVNYEALGDDLLSDKYWFELDGKIHVFDL